MATYYIATTGNDTTGAGTLGNPWLTLAKAFTSSTAGDTIICAAGTYTLVAATEMTTGRIITGAALSGGFPTTIFDGGGVTNTKWSLGGNFTFNNIMWQNAKVTSYYSIIGYNNYVGLSGTATFNNCVIRNSTIQGATADQSGAIGAWNSNSTFILNNCTIYGITVNDSGTLGHIFQLVGTTVLTLNNCSISITATSAYPTKIIYGSSTTCTIKNTIVYNASGATVSFGVTATATYNDFYLITTAPSGTGNITSDPLFVDAANGNFNLRPTSPCIDTGTMV